jgi:hypothetical protein
MPELKIDLYKQHRAEYAATGKPALVKIGKVCYLAIEGQGAPGTESFTTSIGALYGVAFTVKMTRKFAGRQDYAVCKLEAQWWCGVEQDFTTAPKKAWQWKLLIRTPDFVTQKEVDDAVAVLLKRDKGKEVERVRLESLSEGKCVQMLHVGPYEREHETIGFMKAFVASQGLSFQGRHHEIYLSDPRRVAPEKLKTILRMPVVAMHAI